MFNQLVRIICSDDKSYAIAVTMKWIMNYIYYVCMRMISGPFY